jgi:adenylate cyclase
MGREIERKFLVRDPSWREQVRPGSRLRQGYLCGDRKRSVRIRTDGEKATLTIKGETHGASREEFEYRIPPEDARLMLERLCQGALIEKTRYRVPQGELEWEIDVFEGENDGLVVAEIELQSEDQSFDKPAWLGSEVTSDPRYYNANLVRHPYKDWAEEG